MASKASILQLLEQLQTDLAKPLKYKSGVCPDSECQTTLYFPAYEKSVECTSCGQRHDYNDLLDIKDISEMEKGERQRLMTKLYTKQSSSTSEIPLKAEMMKVKGISHYQCKLLSHLLTTYGMDKNGKPKLLKELGPSESFDCSKLAKYAFTIEESHLNQAGYGRDLSGMSYLIDSLSYISEVNGGEVLVPLHADGDGHCLVHAISRCLIGRELFWHSLRLQLHRHLRENLQKYRDTFKDFIEDNEWEDIIDEAAPDYQPPDNRGMGLCNIHVFGLANVLHRPIILLDSLDGMKSSGDYSGVFLPAFVPPSECQHTEGGTLHFNQPIIISWSSRGRNHFIPIVRVQNQQPAQIPLSFLPKVWGVPDESIHMYTQVEEGDWLEVAGGKAMSDSYLSRLVNCMEEAFFEAYHVKPSLVADVDHYIYRKAGYVGSKPMEIMQATRSLLKSGALRRCLLCKAVSTVVPEWFVRGGNLYNLADNEYNLIHDKEYFFSEHNITARYDGRTDSFIPTSIPCTVCDSRESTRVINQDGTVEYKNGDRTDIPSHSSRCNCGFKHFWNGKIYDNLPKKFLLPLTWNGKTVTAEIHWFDNESNKLLNSNAYEIAQQVVEKYFPGEFGSERLVQSAVEIILKTTAKKPGSEVDGWHPESNSQNAEAEGEYDMPPSKTTKNNESSSEVSKLIATGPKSKSLHKEELGVSVTEQKLKKQVEDKVNMLQGGRSHSSRTAELLKRQSLAAKPPPSSTSTNLPPSKPLNLPSPPKNKSNRRIRVTTSTGQSKTLSLDDKLTFSDFKERLQHEFSITQEQFIIRTGIPPRMLVPPENPEEPLNLQNGDKIIVEIPKSLEEEESKPKEKYAIEALQPSNIEEPLSKEISQIQTLLEAIDLWPIAVKTPEMFHRGGVYYEEVKSQFGNRFVDGVHFMLKGFKSKKFSYNAQRDTIELCLGVTHIPVRQLSVDEEKISQLVADDSVSSDNAPSETIVNDTTSGSVYKGGSEGDVQAFSGKGHSMLPSNSNIKEK